MMLGVRYVFLLEIYYPSLSLVSVLFEITKWIIGFEF